MEKTYGLGSIFWAGFKARKSAYNAPECVSEQYFGGACPGPPRTGCAMHAHLALPELADVRAPALTCVASSRTCTCLV